MALCERGEGRQVIVKNITRSFEPESTFTDGLHPDKYYALATRWVAIKDNAIVTEDWSGLREWRKPNRAREVG